MKFLKNILMSIILLGMIAAPLNSVFAQTATGEAVGAGIDATSATAGAVSAAAADAYATFAINSSYASAGAALTACGITDLLVVPVVIGAVFGTQPHLTSICLLEGAAVVPLLTAMTVNTGVIMTNEAKKEVKSTAQKIKDFIAKIAYNLFKKIILDRLVDAMVAWINNDGKGGIISNWDQFFQDSVNNAVGEFVQQLGPPANFLCSPFNLQLNLALLPVEKFSKVTCSLNQIVGNINSFVEDFRNGSWLAYQETWYPKNNFYGATIIAVDEMARTGAEAKDAAQSEGVAGSGFLSQWKDDYYIDNNGRYKDKKGAIAEAGYQGVRYSKGRTLITPGSIAAQAVVESTFTIPGNRLIHADDMAAYLTAIINAAVNKLTKIGVDGLRGWLSERTADTKVNPVFPCAGLTGDGFKACMAAVNTEKQVFDYNKTDARGASTGSLSTRAQVADVYQQSINLQASYVDALSNLIALGKGADRQTELNEEQQIFDNLQTKAQNNQTFMEALIAQDDKINGVTPSTAATPEDYINLGNAANTQFIGDFADAGRELSSAQTELQTIQDKVNSNLSGILSQLPASYQATTTTQ